MNSPHRPDERETWFPGESFPGFQAPEHRQSATTWTPESDPLTGPLPVEPEIPGPPGAGAAGAEPYPSGMAHQHAERLPRYTGPPPATGSVSAPPARSSGDPAGDPPPLRDTATSALPTVPGQPVSGHPGAARPDAESGIPPSLAPMLSKEGQLYAQHTERIGPAAGYPAAPAAPHPYPPQGDAAPPPRSGGRSAVRMAVALATLLAVVPSVLLLYDALFAADVVSASGVVGGTLMLIGLPMLAAGLSPLVSGVPVGSGGISAVLRAPGAYLVVGMVLLLAAGLAVR